MPGDARRTRKASGDDDLELKRARGEISCAECRRLKLKCDKKLPCGSCVRRGCTTICPNGSLSAGQGTRFILADTDQLHRKISEMSERIRQLEDSLAIFQAGVSNDRHPLLRDELLSIKFGPEVRRTVDEENSRDMLSHSLDALGTLTIGDRGESRYFGRSGGSEMLLLDSPIATEVDDPPALSNEIIGITTLFPFSLEYGSEALLNKLETFLPPQPRAWALCEAYLEHFSWWFRPVRRDQLIEDILTPVYNSLKTPPNSRRSYSDHPDSERCPHILGILFMVLAIGALVDLTSEPYNAEAEKYQMLGRAAVCARPILDSPEMETVQAIALMAGYHSICSNRYSLDTAWSLIAFAGRLAKSIGLHRDSRRFKLEEKHAQRRRSLWWEIFFFEILHCQALGRPPGVALAHVDCEFPTDEEQCTSEDGEVYRGYWHYKYTVVRDIMSGVVDLASLAKSPTYLQVLDMDKKIRQMMPPPVRLYLRPEEDDYSNPALCMKSYMLSHHRSMTMVHIHRTFFAQALLDYPSNPLSSPFAPSFLAANRCASILVKSFIHHHERASELCSRFWSMWTNTFASIMILGMTVARIPHAVMAPSALLEMEAAIEIFKKGAAQHVRARQALPQLLKVRERAVQAYTEFRNRNVRPSKVIELAIGPEDQLDNELAIFGGQTRVLPTKRLTRKRQNRMSNVDGSQPTPSGSSPAASSPSEKGSPPHVLTEEFTDLHPSLMEYLSQLPSTASYSVVDQSQHMVDLSSVLPSASMGGTAPPTQIAPAAAAPSPAVAPGFDFVETMLNDPTFADMSFGGFASAAPPNIYGQQTVVGNGAGVPNDEWASLMAATGMFDTGPNSVQNGTPNTFFS